jgi:lysozyme
VVALFAGGRHFWLPQWRPHLHDGERYAIDVSEHQGRVDWAKVRHDGIGLTYLKATEGRDHADSRYRANVDEAVRAGLQTGAYHFFTLCSGGADQAEFFRRTVGAPGLLPPAVDLEIAGNCAARPAPAVVARQLGVFLTAVERWSGRPVVLYVGKDWRERYGLPQDADRPQWVRRLILRPRSPTGWAIWQASDAARVDGIDGRVDLDVVRGTLIPAQVPQNVR